MATDAQLRANAKYKAQKTKQITLEFYPTDMELYDWITEHAPKQTYIKELIRRDIEEKRKF